MKIKPSHCIVITLIALALALGYTIGRTHAIHQARLIDATECEYHIEFGDEIHTYMKGGDSL